MKKYLVNLVRLTVFVTVLFIVFKQIDFALVKKALSKVSVPWLLPAFAGYAMRYFIQGIRWQLAAHAHAQILSLGMTTRAQIEIAFLEIVFPMPDSEDGLKMAYMHRENISLASATAIILYDRIIGISILLLLLPFSFLLFAKNILPGYLQSGSIPPVFLLIMLPLVIFHRILISRMFLLFQKRFPAKTNAMQALRNELQKKIAFSVVLQSLAFTFIYALCGTAVVWLLVEAFYLKASFLFLLAGIPLYYISATLPLSIQGLGLYETALVFILQQQGISNETALAAGVLHFVFHTIIIAAGGILYSFGSKKAQPLGITFIVNPLRKLFGRVP
jgi:uncharacterized membrane protein YbhN (UPF0104 family)